MTLADLLSTYRPRTDVEAADFARVRDLLDRSDSESTPWDRSTTLHVTSSAMIVHPATDQVLLRWHRRQQAWLQVGGHADPGEVDPLEVALREGREETGLDDLVPWPEPVPVHLVIVPVPANPVEPAHEHADLRYVLATARPGQARREHPDAPLRWVRRAEAFAVTSEPNVHETLRRLPGRAPAGRAGRSS